MSRPPLAAAIALVLAFASVTARGDGAAHDDELLGRRYAEKRAQEFMQKIAWLERFDDAVIASEKSGKPILAYFTRSFEACDACDRFENGSLLSSWWVRSSEHIVPYVNIAAKLPKAPDRDRFELSGGHTWPYAVLLDAEGRVLAPVWLGDQASVDAAIEPAALLVAARVRHARKPDKASEQNLALIEAVFAPHDLDLERLKAIAVRDAIDPGIRKYFDELVTTWPIREAFEKGAAAKKKVRHDPEAARRAQVEIDGELYRLYQRKVTVARAEHGLYDAYWSAVFAAAIRAKDVATAAVALRRLTTKLRTRPHADDYLAVLRRQLSELVK